MRLKKEIEELHKDLEDLVKEAKIRGYKDSTQDQSVLYTAIFSIISLIVFSVSIFISFRPGIFSGLFFTGLFTILVFYRKLQLNKEMERREVINEDLVNKSLIIKKQLENKEGEIAYHQGIVSRYR